MQFTYTDPRQWKYSFTINEGDLFVEVVSVDQYGNQVHREHVAMLADGSLRWLQYHTRENDPLVSAEARVYCEKSIHSFLRMKAFW